jgi:hypothetical protein
MNITHLIGLEDEDANIDYAAEAANIVTVFLLSHTVPRYCLIF